MPWAWWRRWRTPPAEIDDLRWAALLARAPLVRGLDPLRQARLRGLAARFLDGKAISPAHGLTLDDDDRLALASHACLPLLGIGEAGLRGWSEVIVHPGAFRVEHGRHGAPHDMDELEVVEDGFEDREGESWEHGPMVLSWADLDAEIRAPEPGYQLVVHEMAHKLDALDGVMDGTPPLPRDWQREWARDFGAAFEALNAELDAREAAAARHGVHDDEEPDEDEAGTRIDPYAAEAPEEFFAVCSEYHFTAPDTLRAAFPAVAEHLERFYGPAPRLDVQ
ncbi:M90 family metallopeptidase [Silanimonas sp.]|jgi:Mlc titration factor MtfA (ptsG expression regulator)|uniref:M90 family metallopeptidase n=1 Tax=Silanimonas sp. TaxID=1929290 RepID=UPI0022C80CD1|nr:M90 family metallopeptidase [Silanimonas sp.]MCZ8114170.1 zinc-dependent peptidase [Silanimonas sp.]